MIALNLLLGAARVTSYLRWHSPEARAKVDARLEARRRRREDSELEVALRSMPLLIEAPLLDRAGPRLGRPWKASDFAGRKGAAKLTPEQRSERARKGNAARWSR